MSSSFSKKREVIPVIKNDAYGHGLVDAAFVLETAGAKYLAVGPVSEAIVLRKAGIKIALIPLLGCFTQQDYEDCLSYNLYVVVHDATSLKGVVRNKIEKIIIKVNSGMGRLGFIKEEIPALIESLQNYSLIPTMLLSHFSSADVLSERDYVKMQSDILVEVTQYFKEVFPDIITSFGNSAATLCYPELSGELTRAGIILYGGNPFYRTEKEYLGNEFKDYMTVKAPVISIHKLLKGESLSYGRSFIAKNDMIVMWIACGYADGYKRSPKANDEYGQGGAKVLVNGKRCPIIGRVNMQMMAVDITDLLKTEQVNVGDYVTILGGECVNRISADELAMWWDTIPHDVLLHFGKVKAK